MPLLVPQPRATPLHAPSLRRELAQGLAPLKGLKPIVGEAGLPTLTPFCWKKIEHPPGVSLSYSRAPAGLQQIGMLSCFKKQKERRGDFSPSDHAADAVALAGCTKISN